MTDLNKRSKAYERFEYYMFEMKDDLSKSFVDTIDTKIIYALSDEEKVSVQTVLIAALEEKFDRRWLWGLEKLKTKEAYDFVMNLYNTEEIISIKAEYAHSLLQMNPDAPVLEFVQQVVKFHESLDTRMSALSSLYPLYDAAFSNEDQHQMCLSILYDAMVDEAEKIRLLAYWILKRYCKMKEFTPIDDPVLNTLKSEEYETAVQLFKDRIQSIEITPISREKIIQWIRDLPDDSQDIEIAECETCRVIPARATVWITRKVSLTEYKSKLETALRFGQNKDTNDEISVMRCPICGRFYIYTHEFYFEKYRSDEKEHLDRVKIDAVIELVDEILENPGYTYTKIMTCGNFLKLIF
ncbi:MAG: hypothetical protein ACFFEE_09405 [Candidatus Thorarchaeota archaeon]